MTTRDLLAGLKESRQTRRYVLRRGDLSPLLASNYRVREHARTLTHCTRRDTGREVGGWDTRHGSHMLTGLSGGRARAGPTSPRFAWGQPVHSATGIGTVGCLFIPLRERGAVPQTEDSTARARALARGFAIGAPPLPLRQTARAFHPPPTFPSPLRSVPYSFPRASLLPVFSPHPFVSELRHLSVRETLSPRLNVLTALYFCSS